MPDNPLDNQITRCPRLGHQVRFEYCRMEGGDLPCRLIIKCWDGRLPIPYILERLFSEEDLKRFYSQPKPQKLADLATLVEQTTPSGEK
ncbi:MAG: hypothetical protein HQK56_09860 [Deltaproteobacteria bacterium]|nr:hypothetical protein [Deltaproteobacteria bacterium]